MWPPRPRPAARLLRGFYPATPDVRWRWTSRVFAFSLDAPPLEREAYLEFEYGLPEELVNEVGGVTLIGSVNGVEIGRETYYRSGHYVFTRYVPVRALTKTPAEVVFELDGSATLPGDGRIIGVNAIAAGLKRFESIINYRINKTLLARQGYNATVEHLQLQLPPEKVLELKLLFARLPVFDKLRFHNIPIGQNPFDLWEVQPEIIVATGTGEGGLPIYLAQTLDGLGLEKSRVLAVDPRYTRARGGSTLSAQKVRRVHQRRAGGSKSGRHNPESGEGQEHGGATECGAERRTCT